MRTGSDSPRSAQEAMEWALEDTGMSLDDIKYVVGTGYGRINVPFANRTITEIAMRYITSDLSTLRGRGSLRLRIRVQIIVYTSLVFHFVPNQAVVDENQDKNDAQ